MEPKEHLEKALEHAEKAADGFEEDSKEESVTENAVVWTKKAVKIVEREQTNE